MADKKKMPLSGTVSSAKAAGKKLGPAAPSVLKQRAKMNTKANKERMAAREAQRRGMAATREQAPARAKAARDAKYRAQDAKMADNKKKWSAANKKGLN